MPPACGADKVEPIELEVVDQRQEIVRPGPRLWTAGIDCRKSEASPVVRNDAIARRLERGHLVFPHTTATGRGMDEHDGGSITTRVAVSEVHARQVGLELARRSLRERRRDGEGHESHSGCDDRSVQPDSYLARWSDDFSFSLQMNSIISESTMRR
jgi:hypothetical protein